jgi:hypothetical protein
MRLLIILFLCLSAAAQTTYTTIASGGTRDVTDATAWVGGVAPPTGCPAAPGFVAVVANGTTLNVPSGVTWCPGASDSVVTTTAVVCASNTTSGTGALNVAAGGTLQARGRLAMCNAPWHIAAGGQILFDSSLATGTPIYTIGTTFADATNAKLYLDGVSFADCTPGVSITTCAYIGVAPGSGNFTIETQISTGNRDGGQVVGQYARLDHCGSATLYCLAADLNASGASLDLNHVLMTNSAGIAIPFVGAGSTLRLHHIAMPSYTGNGTALTFGTGGTIWSAITTGVREVHHSYINGGTVAATFGGTGRDLGLQFYENVWTTTEPTATLAANQTAMPNCTLTGGVWSCTGHFSGSEWHDNMWWQRATDGAAPIPSAPIGYTTRTIDLFDWVGEVCPAWGTSTNNIVHTINSPRFVHQLDGWIFQSRCGGEQNKGLNWSNGGSATSDYPVSITNSLWLPGDNGLGWIVPILGVSSNSCNGTTSFCGRVSFTNNTVAQVSFSSLAAATSDPCGISSESTTISPGSFVETDGNIVWSPAPYHGCVEATQSTSNVPGMYSVRHDRNWIYNLTPWFTGATDGGVDQPFYRFGSSSTYTVTPAGANDQTGDPGFLAYTPGATSKTYRDFLGWCQSINPSDATWSDCYAHFADLYSDSHDTRYTVAAAIDWIRAGYIPRSRLTWTAGPTGGYVGSQRPLGMFPLPGAAGR